MEDLFTIDAEDFYVAFKMGMASLNLFLIAKIAKSSFHREDHYYDIKTIGLSLLMATASALIVPMFLYSWLVGYVPELKSLVIAGIIAFYVGATAKKDMKWGDD